MKTSTISDRWSDLQEKISRAARRAGRSSEHITFVAVTKNVPVERMEEAVRCGIRHLGENRVQEALQKRPRFPDRTWHLIGNLQTNKAKKAVEIFDRIQSLDSLRLADVLNREAENRGKIMPCLVEVKISEEPAKHGLPPDELDGFLNKLSDFPHLSIEGLMAVAPYFDDPEGARPYFRRMRGLFDGNMNRFQGAPLLSMGMSQDFEVAVEEGSNMIRIGTALFGARNA